MSSAEEFRAEIRAWLRANLTGEFAGLRGRGGPGREHEAFAERLTWERHMATEGWTCVGWPKGYGGRGATLEQQVAFHEEYALADAPARVGHIGEQLLGPTLIAFGTPEQRERFLPPIVATEELWCQGYSEPDAGSDLAFERGVSTLGRQVGLRRELEAVIEPAKRNGAAADPLIRDRIAQAWIGLETIRFNALRMLDGAAAGAPAPEASIGKIFWATWHRELGELAMDVCGADGMPAAGEPYDLTDWQRLFLFSRSDTLYAGSNEIQRNIIAERVLGLPKEVRP